MVGVGVVGRGGGGKLFLTRILSIGGTVRVNSVKPGVDNLHTWRQGF